MWIAPADAPQVRLKGSQEEEEDHRHDPYLGELFPTRSMTLAIINHKAITSDRADGFSASPEERPEPGHGQRQRMAPPPWRSRAGPKSMRIPENARSLPGQANTVLAKPSRLVSE